MDCLVPLHRFLVAHHNEVTAELRQFDNNTEWFGVPAFIDDLGKLATMSPVGQDIREPEASREVHSLFSGLLTFWRDFPPEGYLHDMLNVECPAKTEDFRVFLQKLLYNDFMVGWTARRELFLKDLDKLQVELTDNSITFRREDWFETTRDPQTVATYSAPFDSTIEGGTLEDVLRSLHRIQVGAWAVLAGLMERPEQWTVVATESGPQ